MSDASKQTVTSITPSWEIKFDIQQVWQKILSRLSNPMNIISVVWNKEIVEDFSDFIQKLVESLDFWIISFKKENFYKILAEVYNNLENKDELFEVFKENLNVLKSGIDDELYFNLLRLKYNRLNAVLEYVFTKIKNNEFDKINLDKILQLKDKDINIEKQVYERFVEFLKKEEELRNEIKKIIKEELENKVKNKEYKIFRHIITKNERIRKKVLDDIFLLSSKDFDEDIKFKKLKDVVKKLYSIYKKFKEAVADEKNKILKKEIEKLLSQIGLENINSNTYFLFKEWKDDLKKQINNIKDYNIKDWDFRLMLKWLLLQEIQIFAFKLLITNKVEGKKSKEDFLKYRLKINLEKLSQLKQETDNEEKKLTIEKIEKLNMIKNLILQIERKSWISPFLKPLVKQELAGRLNFDTDNMRFILFMLYFVLSQSYKEYEAVYNFFTQVKQIYQKDTNEAQFKKLLNTLSIWLFIFILLIVFHNLDLFKDIIFKTNYFVVLVLLVALIWYVLNFDFKIAGFKKNRYWIYMTALLGIIASLITVIFTKSVLLGLIVLVIGIGMVIFQSIESLKVINTWIYKVLLFLFLLTVFFWIAGKWSYLRNSLASVFSGNEKLIALFLDTSKTTSVENKFIKEKLPTNISNFLK